MPAKQCNGCRPRRRRTTKNPQINADRSCNQPRKNTKIPKKGRTRLLCDPCVLLRLLNQGTIALSLLPRSLGGLSCSSAVKNPFARDILMHGRGAIAHLLRSRCAYLTSEAIERLGVQTIR